MHLNNKKETLGSPCVLCPSCLCCRLVPQAVDPRGPLLHNITGQERPPAFPFFFIHHVQRLRRDLLWEIFSALHLMLPVLMLCFEVCAFDARGALETLSRGIKKITDSNNNKKKQKNKITSKKVDDKHLHEECDSLFDCSLWRSVR